MRDRYPSRIVCLTEETTETLYLLGEGDRIVGVSGYTVRPPEARRKPRVSAFVNANFENIHALRPDLVLAFSDLQADIAAELIRRGAAVMTFNQRTVDEILQMIRIVGALVGRQAGAEALTDRLSAGLDRIRADAERIVPRPRVFFEEWDEPLISGIRWVEELVDIAGGDPIFPELADARLARDRIVDPAEVARRNPEVVFASWCGKKVRAERMRARAGWHSVDAVRNNRIYEIKSTYILQPGPASLTEGVRRLHEALLGDRYPSRRSFLASLGGATVFARAAEPEYRFIQFHNQAAESTLHRHLTAMWTAVARESRGRVAAEVFAENRGTPGSDPAALRMLQAGDIQFFTLMGGILANVVPAMNVQQIPFAFRSPAHALRAMDGALGAYLVQEAAANGLHAFAIGAFDNGMRQIASAGRPVATPGDLAGVRMRVPAGPVFADTFAALGATPVVLNVDEIYGGLKSGRVDAQENPLAVVELFKLYEVVRYVSLTNHMWSGFNLVAHLPTWRRLPQDIRGVIERNATLAVRRQRADQARLNARLRTGLARRGLIFNDVVQAPFRARLADQYRTWRMELGTRCWSLLESS